MRLDTSGIDQVQLARHVEAAYGLEIAAMAFHPEGEASYSYVAEDEAGARWLIKAQETARVVELEARLRAVHYVQAVEGFKQVVAPRENRQGECTSRYAQYTVSVFPFIEGRTIEPGQQTEAYAREAAALMGAFHQHGRRLPFQISRETFENPFEAPINEALRTVEAPGALANSAQEELRNLLLAERTDILTTLETLRQLAAAARGLALDWVLTHGDPNWANILVDGSDTLCLLDWEDLALGPPERDLVFFNDPRPGRFEAFLRHYLALNPGARLHAEVFAFHQYRWVAQEIADYTTRLLFRNLDPAEDEQAWAELRQYVPAGHAAMAAGIGQIEAMLTRVAGAVRGAGS
jgi:aminoglycoside phosphotransferase (APT) family kinase protein